MDTHYNHTGAVAESTINMDVTQEHDRHANLQLQYRWWQT
jgi:hypothetical protein